MVSNNVIDEIGRLNFEDLLWILFIILSLSNIYGDYEEKEYLKTNNYKYKNISNRIFEITLILTFFIYIYFFTRNYKAYEKASEEDKQLYSIKLLVSLFLIIGILCLIYFQTNQKSFVGSPAL